MKCCNDTDCTHRKVKQGLLALKSGEWEEYKTILSEKEVEVSEWASDRIREAFQQVAKDEARKLSTVQEIMKRSTELQQFLVGTLHLVGLWVEKVVRNLWRKIPPEETRQAFGRANRRKC